ncbi:hypothetical protein [Nonomuraea sp. NPDC049141]|uniref:hypothetical protein n=1 Tax=Nonomuraea sp. NPDC049141 TaxID=3155500 RepID=UPI0034025B22
MNIRAGFRALTVASGAAILLIVGSGAASADPVEAETAISCVKKIDSGRYDIIYPWVKVRNDCAWTYDVKIIWNNGPDSPCKELSPGETMKNISSPGASYQRVDLC